MAALAGARVWLQPHQGRDPLRHAPAGRRASSSCQSRTLPVVSSVSKSAATAVAAVPAVIAAIAATVTAVTVGIVLPAGHYRQPAKRNDN